MRISDKLARALGPDPLQFEKPLEAFLKARRLMAEEDMLSGDRFLRRSIKPHLERFWKTFNLRDEDALANYWEQSSNTKNLKTAYLCSFLPANMMRMACVLEEALADLFGPDAPRDDRQLDRPLEVMDVGAGPGAAASALCLIDHPWIARKTRIRALDQSQSMLGLGAEWIDHWAAHHARDIRVASERMDLNPKSLRDFRSFEKWPRVDLWMSSFFLNELRDFKESPRELAEALTVHWDRVCKQQSLIVIVEPGLRETTRKLLELRQALIDRWKADRTSRFSIRLPCGGHQICGALADPKDWCHETAAWWRPPPITFLDKELRQDHKSLTFSYLVIERGFPPHAPRASRIVSGVKKLPGKKRSHELFVCDEKTRRKVRVFGKREMERGDWIDPS